MAQAAVRSRLARLTEGWIPHVVIGLLVSFLVMSPALFTPYGFGPDYTNHLWLMWHQGLAISSSLHPTLYLQSSRGIFEPFYGFYGGTLYAIGGALSALLGNHAYPVYVLSFGACAAFAYAGMWWLSWQLGLGRWASHLPAFVVVTAAYYLTDAYARGAWPEFVALSAVPMFLAGGLFLLTRPWRAWAVALFLLATVVLTGSHNITLLWSAMVIGPIAILLWIVAGKGRPGLRPIAALAALTVVATGINAWFLLLDLSRASDTQAWAQNVDFVHQYGMYFYFDNVWNVLDPLRQTPVQSDIYGLTIAAPVTAFIFGLAVLGLGWANVRRSSVRLRAAWAILLAAMAVLVVLMVIPASWWGSLGTPFTEIQFPYRLAGWLLLLIAVQLALSLRLALNLAGRRRLIAIGLAVALVGLTLAQFGAQMFSSTRLNEETHFVYHSRTEAFEAGPANPPASYYAQGIYGNASGPVIKNEPSRRVDLTVPEPGQTRLEERVALPPGHGPLATNIVGGPYVDRIEGAKRVGRTVSGATVIEPEDPGAHELDLTVVADAGGLESAGVVISIASILAALLLIAILALRPPAAVWSAPLLPRHRRPGRRPVPPS